MADNEVLLLAITNLSDTVKEQNNRHSSFVLKTDNKLDRIQTDVNQYFVLFEKLANIEKTQQDSTKRIHTSIEKIDTSMHKLTARVKSIEDRPVTMLGIITKGFLVACGAGIFTYFSIRYKG